jgi:hypothetical protein
MTSSRRSSLTFTRRIMATEGIRMSATPRILGLAATVATAFAVNLALIDDAFAYIDPGTGTMLLQVAGAMIAAGLFYLRGARMWLSRRLGLGKNEPTPRVDAEGDAGKHE